MPKKNNDQLQDFFPDDYDSFVRLHFNHNFYMKPNLSVQHGDNLTYLDGLYYYVMNTEIEGNINDHKSFTIKYSVKNGFIIMKSETITSLFSFQKLFTANKFLLNFSKELDLIKEFV